ncbi:MAG: hybrid sensor histidine kinase/response regulator [Proteobacteria bacterium]|nr:hybrid sensor histidine kinase/response regulator [Pseudomonadota bacterium]
MDEKLKNARIFIVDDNTKNLQVLGEILSGKGYKLGFAEDGIRALKAIQTILPDLILLDVMMPEMDGFETCRQLKALPPTRDIPIIFLTAKTEAEDIVKGFEYGAVDYVTKPFNPAELMARVGMHLDLKFCRETILQKSAEQKELLHILCHDLVSPMSAAKIIFTMSKNKPDEWFIKKKNFMELAIDNGLETVELVRKMRALEEKGGDFELSSINLKKALDETLAIIQERFSQKDIKPVVDVDENLNIQVEKTSFVNSVLSNLFTNAIKFSFPGSRIKTTARQEEDKVVLRITDFGIGMPETLLNDVFETNKATSRKGTAGEKGTGFGMPLVKKFVTAYGGTIEISSKEESESPDNHGTQVELVLNTS